jgi:phosphoglycolate phosphatase-like HAD superfamily hydrolase
VPVSALLLFDIDGTLLGRAADAHSEALHAALLEVHRVDTRALSHAVSPAGRTDGEIARTLLLDAGVSARQIDERALDVREACCRSYAQLCPPDLSDKVLPGIAELLAQLTDRDDVKLSLVTGNFECVARLKLLRAGIGNYFARGQGGFGSDSDDRAGLPPLARRRAGALGVPFPRGQTIVIGDTPRDIACAHADEVRCFAVATGPYKAAELTGADAVASDGVQLGAILEYALDGGRGSRPGHGRGMG